MPSFHDTLEFARQNTRILKSRKNLLYTFGATKLPYICVSDANGAVMIREGEVTADKPKIAIPDEDFNFDGFDTDDLPESGILPVMLARSVKMPIGNYTNKENSTRQGAGSLSAAVDTEMKRLEQENDIRTGVICAPESVWKLAVLFYVGEQIVRSAESNITEHFERLRRQND